MCQGKEKGVNIVNNFSRFCLLFLVSYLLARFYTTKFLVFTLSRKSISRKDTVAKLLVTLLTDLFSILFVTSSQLSKNCIPRTEGATYTQLFLSLWRVVQKIKQLHLTRDFYAKKCVTTFKHVPYAYFF